MRWLCVILFAFCCEKVFSGHPEFDQNDSQNTPDLMQDYSFNDIKLTEIQEDAIRKGKDVRSHQGFAFAGNNEVTKKWPNAIIPFKIDCSLEYMPSALTAIRKAMDQWESKTCIRFVNRTNEEEYVTFFRSPGCWSYVGIIGGGRNKISVGPRCDYEHIMVHEIGHTIGFWHEQSRPDRDDYIEIHWENIHESMKRNFRKVNDSYSYGVPYDYASIMHYPWTAFSKNRKPTMSPKKTVTIQPYIALSDGDALQANRMYNCKATRKKRSLSSGCVDIEPTPYCEKMSREKSACSRNHTMLNNCQKTCKSPLCDESVPCVDKRKNCEAWANDPRDLCKISRIVQQLCIKSCAKRCIPPKKIKKGVRLGKGTLCLDLHVKCPMWERWGHCAIENGYVPTNCKLSCNSTDCDRGIQRPKGTCNNPLGIAWNGTGSRIPDSALTSNSEYSLGDMTFYATSGRLYFIGNPEEFKENVWCVKSWEDFRNKNPYMQVDLGRTKNIKYIATQGRDNQYERVSKYKVAYSNNGIDFQYYMEDNMETIFGGNCDHFTPVVNEFENVITARYVRVHPLEANYPCMRMELYGC